MRVVKRQIPQICQAIEVQRVFERADSIAADVEVLQFVESVQGVLEKLHAIASQMQLPEFFQAIDALDFLMIYRISQK